MLKSGVKKDSGQALVIINDVLEEDFSHVLFPITLRKPVLPCSIGIVSNFQKFFFTPFFTNLRISSWFKSK